MSPTQISLTQAFARPLERGIAIAVLHFALTKYLGEEVVHDWLTREPLVSTFALKTLAYQRSPEILARMEEERHLLDLETLARLHNISFNKMSFVPG